MKTMPREGLHIVIQRSFSTIGGDSGARPQFLDALYEATMIGTGGLPLSGYNKVFFEGTAIFQFLAEISTVKSRFISSINVLMFCVLNCSCYLSGAVFLLRRRRGSGWRRYVDDFWCNVAQTKHSDSHMFHPKFFLVLPTLHGATKRHS
jgi:hypothetical protein